MSTGRNEGESFEDYKIRRKLEKQEEIAHVKGAFYAPTHIRGLPIKQYLAKIKERVQQKRMEELEHESEKIDSREGSNGQRG